MAGPLFAFVDWAKDGTFAAAPAADDVTDRIRGNITCRYGRDSDNPATIAAGTGAFNVDNTSRDYSPRNASSPLFGNLKPARPVLVQRTISSTTYTLFRGHTDDSPIDPDINSKTVTLNLIDSLADFRGVTITTTLFQGLRSGDAIGKILDAAGWTGGRDIDSGASVFPFWWEDGTDAYEALQKVLASEGPPALLSMGVTGEVIFRDRHHRLVRSASKTSQATFSGSGSTEPVMQGMTYSGNWASVVNSVTLSVDERSAGRDTPDPAPVWQTDEVINIGASQSYVVVVQASDPFLGAVAPVAGTDFTIVSGTVTATSISRTSGVSTSMTITAGAGGAALSGMAVRAYSVPVVRTVQVSATDATSITDYGARGIPSGLQPVWCTRADAQAIADLWVLTRKQPPALVTARFTCGDQQTTKLAALLARNLSDRVTVVEAETVLNDPFYMEAIAHTVENLTEHTMEITCEAVPAAPTSVFILGTSLLNGADPLGY
jgi:hypothetical protein